MNFTIMDALQPGCVFITFMNIMDRSWSTVCCYCSDYCTVLYLKQMGLFQNTFLIVELIPFLNTSLIRIFSQICTTSSNSILTIGLFSFIIYPAFSAILVCLFVQYPIMFLNDIRWLAKSRQSCFSIKIYCSEKGYK